MENQSLMVLWIQKCDIDSHGVKCIKDLLLQSRTLINLTLNENNIGDQGAQYLSKCAQFVVEMISGIIFAHACHVICAIFHRRCAASCK